MPMLDPNIRKEYERGRLLEADLPPEPLPLFEEWLRTAVEAGLREPNAMTLATATPDGRPSARVLLLKSVDARGFSFFTNYASRKGEELAANPWAALCFWWGELERQVRVEGRVEQLPPAESDAYYASRPHGSRLGAWASAQSRVIAGRELLETKLAALQQQYAASDPPRPPYWGGYLLRPQQIEFWQGGPHRLHDRIRYTRTDSSTGDSADDSADDSASDGWRIERLSP